VQFLTPDSVRGRVGFVVPRWTTGPSSDRQGVPFRSIAVASAIFNAGYEIVWFDEAVDVNGKDGTGEFLKAVDGARAVFFWLNELTPAVQMGGVLRLATQVREAHPEIPTCVGGPFITLCPPEVLYGDYGPVDYFLRSESEDPAPQFLAALEGREPLDGVSGLVWPRERRHAAVRPHVRFRAEHTSVYRHLDLTPYIQRIGGFFGNGEPTLAIGTGRGCAKGCSFCYWTNFEPSLLDPGAIVDLVEFLRGRYGVRQFHLAELDFFTNRARPLGMARLWRERVPDCGWFTLASPVDAMRFTEADWDLLAEGGCRKLEFGTESGSARMLRAIRKRHRPDDPWELARITLRRGIASMHNFVFGLVGETEEDRRASCRLILRLGDLDPERVYFTFRFFQAAWDVPMGEEAIAQTEGFPRSLREVLDYRPVYGDVGGRALQWLTAEEERRVKTMVYYFLPIVSSRLVYPERWRQGLYRGLRSLARVRAQRGWFGLGADRWLFQRALGGGLDCTYTA
jgi:radical SAM superfamily enzyme YgiQ (UPF0313 family)